MKRFKRLTLIFVALIVIYVGAYCLLVRREPPYSYTGAGPRLMQARYVPKGNPTPERNDIQDVAHTLFSPLEWLDRQVLPARWEAPPPKLRPPPGPNHTTAS